MLQTYEWKPKKLTCASLKEILEAASYDIKIETFLVYDGATPLLRNYELCFAADRINETNNKVY